jgi:hypothetical protein
VPAGLMFRVQRIGRIKRRPIRGREESRREPLAELARLRL